MARPDPHGRAHRPRGPGVQGSDVDHDEELQEPERESELDRAQNQYGNAALSALLGASSSAAGDGGAARALTQRDGEELAGPAHGGDDDPVDDGPITLEDLTRSWNPRIKREKDRPAFRDAMPDPDLGDEDAAWLAEVRRAPIPDLPPSTTPDGLLQPTAHAVRSALTGWIREAEAWTARSPAHRALAAALAPPAACLQDPHGRVLLARARAGAAATLLLLDGARDLDQAPVAGLVQLCLEVAGSRRRLAEIEDLAAEAGELPAARAVAAAHLPAGHRRAIGAEAPPGAARRLAAAVRRLVDPPPASAALPSFPDAPEADDDDDPLGLDAILAEHTGGRPDPEAASYQACVAAAERLAGQVARLRVRFAGAAAAVGAACRHWTAGPPTADLLAAMGRLDAESGAVLSLLVDVARAAQKRTVALRGIRNGLKRAARAVDALARTGERDLARIGASVLPGRPDPEPVGPAPDPDPLDLALGERDPLAARPWLEALPPGDRDVALALLPALAGRPAAEALAPLQAAASEARPLLALALEQLVGSCLLWTGDLDGALALSARHLDLGVARRNGLLVAAATLLAMEAHLARGDARSAAEARLRGGVLAWRMAAPAALTLLARWRPPEEGDDPTC